MAATSADKPSKAVNPMRDIVIDKLVINIAVGEQGDKTTRAVKVLHDLTEQRPVESKAKLTVRSFSIRRGERIACHATVRGEKAAELLERGLKVKEFELRKQNFSETGNFGFGISEHIDLGVKYDVSTGIYGMDFYVSLKRRGFRIAHKKHGRSRVGAKHRISASEAIQWFVKTYEGIVLDKKKEKNKSGWRGKGKKGRK
eukprot:TRINITY_DN3800_c0_g1_i1.p1 TRINITY_DN3800_c0_g1~~TRINITY_DN3800_c0_g1_i1.p1  ORF type:complete len:216 (+),score=44.60 TRINITY_DN3800_c0_g1_i1:50-649(+)